MPTYQDIIKWIGTLLSSVLVLSISLLIVYSIIGYLASSKSETNNPTCPEKECPMCPRLPECPRCPSYPSCPACPECPLCPESLAP
jgi:hypothetical protein